MLKNYLTIALRNLRKQRGYSFINVAGLSVGLACSFFILLWVMDEVRYDRFHEHGDRLYRVLRNAEFGGQKYTWGAIPKPLVQELEEKYPDVEHAVLMSWEDRSVIARGEQSFRETGFHAGPAFFEIFTFPLAVGDPATVIDDPNSMAISASLAAKLFGSDWRERGGVVGQTLNVDHRKDFVVRGVFEDVPDHSTLEFDFVLPVQEFIDRNAWVEHWGNNGMQMFVSLRPGASGPETTAKIEGIIRQHQDSTNVNLFLQPVPELRLYSRYEEWKLVGGRIEYVRIFAVVAVFLLVIACINFMNLATARSMQRAREIGVRKVVGAGRRALMTQFLTESVLIALFALVLAFALVFALLPAYNTLTGKTTGAGDLGLPFVAAGIGVALLTGLLAGSYPALYLSGFNPTAILRGTLRQGAGAASLRKGLVVFQFALSILLIVATVAVYRQVQFIRHKNLGLDRENVIMLPREGGARTQYDAYRQELLRQPGIQLVTTSSQNPLNVGSSTTDPDWEGKSPDNNTLFHIINANHGFVEAMRMELVAGRAFSEEFATDTLNYVVNEEAVRAMGMENPIGQRLDFWGQEGGQIIGVVKNFHIASLYQEIEPTIIRLDPEETWQVFVRTEPGRTEQALEALRTVHARFNPGFPFEYEFLDKRYEDAYRSEITMGKLANLFAIVATFISCLGLFGLASFTAERRTKEIGIRKVMGASVTSLVFLLSLGFTRLVLVAFVLAAPVAYYAANQWLGNFEYHAELGYGVFVLAGVAALAIAWLTVSYQALRAATANPVKSLRTE